MSGLTEIIRNNSLSSYKPELVNGSSFIYYTNSHFNRTQNRKYITIQSVTITPTWDEKQQPKLIYIHSQAWESGKYYVMPVLSSGNVLYHQERITYAFNGESSNAWEVHISDENMRPLKLKDGHVVLVANIHE